MAGLTLQAVVGILLTAPYMYIVISGHQFVNILGSAFLKAVPILWLAAACYALYSSVPAQSGKEKGKNASDTTGSYARNIAFGLVFSAFGDASLELAGNNETIFVGGLASFLVAHLFYSRAFMLSNWNVNLGYLTGVAGYMLIVLYHVIPNVEKNLVGPVAVYGCVIGIMLHNSMVRTAPSNASFLCSLAGATVFTISDTILSFDEFAMPGKIPYAHLAVMVTYYIAQILITLSVSGPVIVASKKGK